MASNVYLAEEMSGVCVRCCNRYCQKKTSDSVCELTFHQDLYLSNS